MTFYMGYEKNMSFLVIPKSLKVGKKVEKIGLGSFKIQISMAVENVSHYLKIQIDKAIKNCPFYL